MFWNAIMKSFADFNELSTYSGPSTARRTSRPRSNSSSMVSSLCSVIAEAPCGNGNESVRSSAHVKGYGRMKRLAARKHHVEHRVDVVAVLLRGQVLLLHVRVDMTRLDRADQDVRGRVGIDDCQEADRRGLVQPRGELCAQLVRRRLRQARFNACRTQSHRGRDDGAEILVDLDEHVP